MTFKGFPPELLEFYSELEVRNEKAFWEANKDVYDTAVRAPMEALLEELEEEFGTAKIFRPYRDVRFSKDKTPYKTEIAAAIMADGSGGLYVRVNADGVGAGGGYYQMAADQLARYRQVVDDGGKAVNELDGVLGELVASGGQVHSDELKTAPKGWSKEHPRIDLLRRKSLTYFREQPPGPAMHSPAVLEQVRETFRSARPLVRWLDDHVGPSQAPRRR